MEDESFKEKRRYIRFDNPDINFKTKELGGIKSRENIVQALAVNMSAEGVCFISNTKLPPGSIIELDILIPFRPQPTHIKGEVRWSDLVKTGENKGMFATGVRLSKEDESIFLLYICDRMQERIRELERELRKNLT